MGALGLSLRRRGLGDVNSLRRSDWRGLANVSTVLSLSPNDLYCSLYYCWQKTYEEETEVAHRRLEKKLINLEFLV